MRLYDHNDYSSESDTRSVSLLLSERSRALILAAMSNLDPRWRWITQSDAQWDDTEEMVAEALNEVMDDTMPDFTPVGTIANFVSTTVPDKWLYLNGQRVDRADYPELWDITPSTWHNVPPTTSPDNILLPDMRDKFAQGATNSTVIGASGGAATHTLTIAEMPAHTHGIPVGTASGASLLRAAPSNNVGLNTFASTSQGGGGAHNNIPPYTFLTFMIKALP